MTSEQIGITYPGVVAGALSVGVAGRGESLRQVWLSGTQQTLHGAHQPERLLRQLLRGHFLHQPSRRPPASHMLLENYV